MQREWRRKGEGAQPGLPACCHPAGGGETRHDCSRRGCQTQALFVMLSLRDVHCDEFGWCMYPDGCQNLKARSAYPQPLCILY